MTVATNTHIAIDERGRPRVARTGFKVDHIVMHMRKGNSPEEIREGFPELSMSEIHAALSYYYDHKAEIDASIEAGEREYQRLRAEAIASGRQPTRAELERRLAERGKSA